MGTALKNLKDKLESLLQPVDPENVQYSDEILINVEFDEFKQQGVTLLDEPEYSRTEAALDVNRKKNRYRDIIPFDKNRVRLNELEGDGAVCSDYINASIIKGASGEDEYIAAQGPLQRTVNDFWRMIWEYGIKVVVMACRERDGEKIKCSTYWPTTLNETKTFDKLTVELVGEDMHVYGHHTVRRLRVTRNDETKTVIQHHYIGWPDHGIPTSMEPIINLIYAMRRSQDHSKSPLLIHCSAGCGRTGTLIALDSISNMFELDLIKDNLDIFKICLDLRKQRMSMVQTKDQYEMIYRGAIFILNEKESIEHNDYENLPSDTTKPAKPKPPIKKRKPTIKEQRMLADNSSLAAQLMGDNGSPVLSPSTQQSIPPLPLAQQENAPVTDIRPALPTPTGERPLPTPTETRPLSSSKETSRPALPTPSESRPLPTPTETRPLPSPKDAQRFPFPTPSETRPLTTPNTVEKPFHSNVQDQIQALLSEPQSEPPALPFRDQMPSSLPLTNVTSKPPIPCKGKPQSPPAIPSRGSSKSAVNPVQSSENVTPLRKSAPVTSNARPQANDAPNLNSAIYSKLNEATTPSVLLSPTPSTKPTINPTYTDPSMEKPVSATIMIDDSGEVEYGELPKNFQQGLKIPETVSRNCDSANNITDNHQTYASIDYGLRENTTTDNTVTMRRNEESDTYAYADPHALNKWSLQKIARGYEDVDTLPLGSSEYEDVDEENPTPPPVPMKSRAAYMDYNSESSASNTSLNTDLKSPSQPLANFVKGIQGAFKGLGMKKNKQQDTISEAAFDINYHIYKDCNIAFPNKVPKPRGNVPTPQNLK